MYKKLLLERILPYKALGYRLLEDGTELFGNDKSIAPQAWLHQIYPALDDTDISKIEFAIQSKLPTSLKDFYQEMNGFSLFVIKMSISGLRNDNLQGIESVWQPNSINTPNNDERPYNALYEDIFFAFFAESGNKAYINLKSEKVSICNRNDATALTTYRNLYKFFEKEVTNLFALFNKKYFPNLSEKNR